MKYRSTRGHSTLLSFEEAVLQGLAPDGGLYIPVEIPKFTPTQINNWSDLSFNELAFNLYRPYIEESDIPSLDLKDLCLRSFKTFTHPEVTPLKKLPNLSPNITDRNLENLWVLELFHGPTFAFKDVALQFLGNLFEYFLKRKNLNLSAQTSITVVGATSGDTGGAAIYGLRGKENIEVFILHPHNRISKVQEVQMTSVLDHNVHNVALEGSFDNCQDIVKALFSDADFKKKYKLGAINSINWARILAQTTYYFYSFFQLMKQNNVPMNVSSFQSLCKVQYSVPSGNFGDVLAGFYAKQMGLPIHKLVIATNSNDILDRFLKSGRYERSNDSSDPVKQTISPAMDILISSNFERLLWYLIQSSDSQFHNKCDEISAADVCKSLNSLMLQLKSKGGFNVSTQVLNLARTIFDSRSVNDSDTLKTMKRYYHHQYSIVDPGDKSVCYILDPHTAVGVYAAETVLKESDSESIIQTICLATASPGKFPDAVLDALNQDLPIESIQRGFQILKFEDFAPKRLVELTGLPQRMTVIKTDGDKAKGLTLTRKVIEQTLERN